MQIGERVWRGWGEVASKMAPAEAVEEYKRANKHRNDNLNRETTPKGWLREGPLDKKLAPPRKRGGDYCDGKI